MLFSLRGGYVLLTVLSKNPSCLECYIFCLTDPGTSAQIKNSDFTSSLLIVGYWLKNKKHMIVMYLYSHVKNYVHVMETVFQYD